MTREHFEHAIRAAGAVLGVNELLVIGSQALHGSVTGELPEEASRSIEVDVAAMHDDDGRRADLIDGSIGEASVFHETFGYYAQGVVEKTAILPNGWRERLVRFPLCLYRKTEPLHLWITIASNLANGPRDNARPSLYRHYRGRRRFDYRDRAGGQMGARS